MGMNHKSKLARMVPHSQPTTSQVRYLIVLDAKNGTSSSVVPDMNPAGMISRSDVNSLNPKLLMMIGMNDETGPLAMTIYLSQLGTYIVSVR